ncbi:hypothetical protein NKR23_g83 [Pleurostoma richardsiae]|uniref:Sphingoid long-chain base transporter RSB1 n=1 Tax=Pleurostoma richardsiae TaxID=41990 RepID=A0AA38S215_9PEZI|nr:hypothetical protein NKR23_g83 [Pleurostoma richardsiae]
MSPDLEACTFETCSVSDSPYGYRPSLIANACFLAAISLCLIACLGITTIRRRCLGISFLLATCCSLELVAYSQRVMGWRDPWDVTYYDIGLIFSTVSPVFLTSAIHLSAAKLTTALGAEHALLPSFLHARLLIPLDVVAFAAQALGLAITLADSTPHAGLGPLAASGRWSAAAGLALQAAGVAVCLAHLAVLLARAASAARRHGYTTFHRGRGYVPLGRGVRLAAVGVPTAAALALARCAYGAVVFVGGLRGGLARDQELFIGLEGVAVTAALGLAVASHPGLWPRSAGNDGDGDAAEKGRGKRLRDGPENRLSREVEETLDEVSSLILRHSRLLEASSSDGSSEASDRTSLMSGRGFRGVPSEVSDRTSLVSDTRSEVDIGIAR